MEPVLFHLSAVYGDIVCGGGCLTMVYQKNFVDQFHALASWFCSGLATQVASGQLSVELQLPILPVWPLCALCCARFCLFDVSGRWFQLVGLLYSPRSHPCWLWSSFLRPGLLELTLSPLPGWSTHVIRSGWMSREFELVCLVGCGSGLGSCSAWLVGSCSICFCSLSIFSLNVAISRDFSSATSSKICFSFVAFCAVFSDSLAFLWLPCVFCLCPNLLETASRFLPLEVGDRNTLLLLYQAIVHWVMVALSTVQHRISIYDNWKASMPRD